MAPFDEAYNCSVINADILVYTNGNETYDGVLLPIIKESMDSGAFIDVHPAIVNTIFVNQSESEGDQVSSSSSSGIQNPAWFALVGVAVVAVVVGFVLWKKRKEKKQPAGFEIAEAAPESNMTKAVPIEAFEKTQASYTPGVQNALVDESISQDQTFEIDSEDDEEFEC